MRRLRSILVLGIAALALAACSEVREDLGLGRSAPDEFAVVDRPPLSMPPDFGLRPPQPGAPRPQEVDVSQRANDVLFGADKMTQPAGTAPAANGGASDAEKALLVQTGADKASPDIRSIINREAAEKVTVQRHLVEDLLWWKKKPPTGVAVDAPAEAARIQEAKAKGAPINQGATPIIEREKESWLGL